MVIWLEPGLVEFGKIVAECKSISSEALKAIQMKNNKALIEEPVELMKKKRWIVRLLCYTMLGIWQLICCEVHKDKALFLKGPRPCQCC